MGIRIRHFTYMAAVAAGGSLWSLPARAATLDLVIGMGDLVVIFSATIGVLSVIWALREHRTASEAAASVQEHARSVAAARADLETLSDEGIGPAVIFDGQKVIRVTGGFGKGHPISNPEDLLTIVASDDREFARSSLGELLSDGTRFSRTFGALQGGAVRRTGYPAGAFAVVRVRDMTGEYRETAMNDPYDDPAGQPDIGVDELLSAAPFPIWRRDLDHNPVWVNDAYARVVEAPDPNTAVAATMPLSVAGNGMNSCRFLDLAWAAQSSGERQRILSFVIIDGARRSFEIVETPTGAATAGFAQDLTGVRKAESALRRHTRAHAETLDGLTTAIAIYGADKRLNFYNDAYVKLWQMDSSCLDSGPSEGDVLEFLRERRRIPEQADFRAWKESRLPLYTNPIEAQEDLWHLPNDRMLRLTVRSHPMGGVMHVYEDVTHQVTMERNYNALAGTHRATLDTLSEGVVVFGTNGKLTLFNPAFESIFSLPAKVLLREPHVTNVVDFCREIGGTEEQWMSIIINVVTQIGGEREGLADRFEAIDGRVLECASATLPDGAIMMTFFDVTATAAVERALIDRNKALAVADQLKAEFISHVSYELRTPLNSIIGFAEMLKSGIYGDLDDLQTQRMDDIHGSSRQLLGLINNMLDLATAQAGQLALDFGKVNPRALLNSVMALGRQRAGDNGITIKSSCSKSLPEIDGDITRLLFNILTNSIRYTTKGGTITLIARAGDEGQTVFAVADTGSGIMPELHDKVFGDFETRRNLGDARNRDDGAGQYLPLVKHIVVLCRTEITARQRYQGVPDPAGGCRQDRGR